MALHRDIFWVGRQWAVTGFGVQAVDQRLKGAFDLEATKLWEDDLPQRMRALAWLNAEDFSKALELARARFPEPPRKKGLPLVESVLELIPSAVPEAPKPEAPKRMMPPPVVKAKATEASPKPEASKPTAKPEEQARLTEASPKPTKPPLAAPLAIDLSQPRKEPPQAKPSPLAMRIEHVSAKFLPRWRVRQ